VPPFVKRRPPAVPGSIPDVLGMFTGEVRFYREIAPLLGVRVPACYTAEDNADGTLLVLEDLSGWAPGADPAKAARVLSGMHHRWSGAGPVRWPWLRPVGAAIDLVEELYGQTWPHLAQRGDLPRSVAAFSEALLGRVTDAERAILDAGPLTIIHGDAQARNMRTGPAGEVALLDWEDVSAAPGLLDLAWLLTSSTDPDRWDEVIDAYGPAAGLHHALPAVIVQGLLSMTGEPPGSPEARAWTARLDEACSRLR
jgi:Phosphotransferase enzyme family